MIFADYFVICTGINERQLQTIADEIKVKLKKRSIQNIGIEGYNEAKWILMDYGDVIVHLFSKEMRSFYELELLWGDAPKVTWSMFTGNLCEGFFTKVKNCLFSSAFEVSIFQLRSSIHV